EGIIRIAIRRHSNLLHITTRQEIQIQNLSLSEIEAILHELQAIGLSSKGGGGNTVRNILVAVDSGIGKHEVFDPTPYAMALTTKLIAENDSFTLPRKLKIAFANNENETDYAAVNDVGLVARIRGGKRGFKVYIGGSVASHPTVGWVFSEFLPEENLFALLNAVKKFFSEHGNRKNKHKARLRHIFYKLGAEETLRILNEYYQESLSLPVKTPSFGHSTSAGNAVSVIVPFVLGNIPLNNRESVDKLLELLQFVARFGDDTLRFSTQQNIHLRNIPEEALPELRRYIDADTPLLANNIVSCTGADTCRLGICLSKGLATAIRKELLKLPGEILNEASHLRIHISGCPNSCGQQVWADLGFSGKVMRNSRIYPGYQVYAGAARGANPQLAETLGDVNAKDAPEFVSQIIVNYVELKGQYADFREYIQSAGKDYIKQLLARYKNTPSFDDDKNYYFDWGAESLFSIAERGVAECSAGLFDMIDLDLKYIKEYRKQLEEESDPLKINSLLRNTVYSASRMLLVTRGAEPKTTEDVYSLFLTHFIDAGIVGQQFAGIVRAARDSGYYDFAAHKSEIDTLANTIIELYQNMDDSLQFKNTKPVEQAVDVVDKPAADERKFKDLRGVACPMNFVQTKILLSSMPAGALLEIWLDDGQPINNVPGSVRGEGHEILEQTSIEDYWKVVIRK
ncbi:MAG: sulfurtransferase TusA family protein, partial [Dysgonamonadaceae bacterium]|nr:sulfurtransferase TusA family protein [Dysgonamonadaceae bacterium]